MLRPTILIKKQKIFDDKGWSRYYQMAKLDLNEVPIYTEGQLIWWIHKNFGQGRFQILAWKQKRKGFWLFWIGEISEEGFMFDAKKITERDEVKMLKDELEEETDSEMKMFLQEMIKDERANFAAKMYGFYPYLRPSGQRGKFTFWEDAK